MIANGEDDSFCKNLCMYCMLPYCVMTELSVKLLIKGTVYSAHGTTQTQNHEQKFVNKEV